MGEPRAALYARAIAHFGEKHQKMKAVEEMAELTKVICDYEQGRCDVMAVAGEIADVLITVGQLIQIYNCREAVSRIVKEKLLRLKRLIEGGKKWHMKN